jgi:hypothetical protein
LDIVNLTQKVHMAEYLSRPQQNEFDKKHRELRQLNENYRRLKEDHQLLDQDYHMYIEKHKWDAYCSRLNDRRHRLDDYHDQLEKMFKDDHQRLDDHRRKLSNVLNNKQKLTEYCHQSEHEWHQKFANYQCRLDDYNHMLYDYYRRLDDYRRRLDRDMTSSLTSFSSSSDETSQES